MTLALSTEVRRRYATAAVAGVLLYVGVDAILQLLPPHYSVLHEAESNLAVGPFGWIMAVNFLGRAATTVCMVAAIARTGTASRPRWVGMMLLMVGAACSAILPLFPTDVGPGSELGSGSHTVRGLVHLWVAGVGFVAALAAVIVLTGWLRTIPGLARVVPAAVFFAGLATVGLVWLGLSGAFGLGLVGLAERFCLAGILGWAFVVCLAIRRDGLLPARSK